MLRKARDKFNPEYKFVKNQAVAIFFGCWCFALTLASCILKMYDKNHTTFALNVITPIVLIILGLVLPVIANIEKENKKKI
jgi:hypothetical protein